jgi:hypothetical protein
VDTTLYPKDHKLGMVVPLGGSNCAKCEYLSGDSDCSNKAFQRWNGGKSKLPASASRYCCDLFEADKKKLSARLTDLKGKGKLGGTRK